MKQAPWLPASLERRRPFLEARGRIKSALHAVFENQVFLEVETPILQESPGMEPHLKAFATKLEEPFGDESGLYLHTSPEFAMKKLLAAGLSRIYQFARCFRNGERSVLHHPEFTMLEWYRAGAGTKDLMEDCRLLLQAALTAVGRTSFIWEGQSCDPFQPWERLSVEDAFRRETGIDLLATAPDPRHPDRDALAAQARGIGLHVGNDDRWDDIFFRIFLERIEAKMGQGVPTLLHSYPLSMAALARPDPHDPRLADRFELYVCGVELANAFGELTDPAEQRRRFECDQSLKESLYGERYPIDEDFLTALGHMPESSGIALGFDRLVILASGGETLEDVLWLPVIRAKNSK
jgi:lysyl-tRNA synthetase class 2